MSVEVARGLQKAAALSAPAKASKADLGSLEDLEGHAKRNRSEKVGKSHRRKVDGSDSDYGLALAEIRAKHKYGLTMYNHGSAPSAPMDPEAGKKHLTEAVEQAHAIQNAMS